VLIKLYRLVTELNLEAMLWAAWLALAEGLLPIAASLPPWRVR
jgi:hypothetical protein